MDCFGGLVSCGGVKSNLPNYIIPSAKSAFFDKLNNARRDGFLCDIFFEVGEERRRFCAHRLVLGISSTVFQTCFYGSLASKDGTSEENPTFIPDINADAFELLLAFIYSDQNIDSIEVTDQIVVHLLYAAEKYDLLTLKHACLQHLKELDLLNATSTLLQALQYNDSFIVELCCEIIYANVNAFLFSSEFFTCDLRILESIIGNDDFTPDSELLLLERLLEWSSAKCQEEGKEVTSENKREVLGEALYLVRFPLMSMFELQKVAQLNILPKQDLANLFLHAVDPSMVLEKFVARRRSPYVSSTSEGSKQSKLELMVPKYCSVLRRFSRFEESEHKFDNFTVFFKADRKITLIGIGIFDFCDGSFDLRLEDCRVDFAPLETWHKEAKQIEMQSLHKTDGKVLQLISDRFPALLPDRYYAMRIEVKGSAHKRRYKGTTGFVTTVHFERERNIKFYFDNYDSTYNRFLDEIYFIL